VYARLNARAMTDAQLNKNAAALVAGEFAVPLMPLMVNHATSLASCPAPAKFQTVNQAAFKANKWDEGHEIQIYDDYIMFHCF
jgi:hypothetical protein